MWPVQSWLEAGETWRLAEEFGVGTAWVYDHLAWRGTTPWYDAYTTLAAAAAVTSRVRLGTLVTSPNFRHPVPTAHAIKTIDHISGGRMEAGIGAGGTRRTSDSGVLGGEEWTPGERSARFAEWTELLDRLLRGPVTTYEGAYYSARDAVSEPGCVQRPRVPLVIAATGTRGLRLAARLGDGWVTTANVPGRDPADVAREQLDALHKACDEEGRDPAELRRHLLTGFTGEPWLESPAAFDDLVGRYAELGFTDIVLHWPRPDTPWEADLNIFETITTTYATPAS